MIVPDIDYVKLLDKGLNEDEINSLYMNAYDKLYLKLYDYNLQDEFIKYMESLNKEEINKLSKLNINYMNFKKYKHQ
jgi:hypothetical protein